MIFGRFPNGKELPNLDKHARSEVGKADLNEECFQNHIELDVD